MNLYVTPDPNSLRDAEERERREREAQSSIVSIRIETAEQRRHADFWRKVDQRLASRAVSRPARTGLRLVGER